MFFFAGGGGGRVCEHVMRVSILRGATMSFVYKGSGVLSFIWHGYPLGIIMFHCIMSVSTWFTAYRRPQPIVIDNVRNLLFPMRRSATECTSRSCPFCPLASMRGCVDPGTGWGG